MSGSEAIHYQQIQRRRSHAEEEEMSTNMPLDDLHSWEFKIIRSNTKAFKKRLSLAKALERESLGGWQLFEKLDNGRVRLKRPVTERREDNLRPSGYDPYRIQYGPSEAGLAAMLVAIVLSIALVGIALSYAL